MLHWTKQKNSNSGQFPREAWEQYNKIKTLHHLIANSKLSPRFLENKLASVWSMGSNFGNLNWIGIWETEKQVWCGCRKIEKIWSKHLLQTRAQFSFYEDNCQPRQFWFKPLIIWKRCPFWSKTKRIREVKLTYGRSWSEWRSPFRAPIAEVSHLTKKASKFLATIITSEQNRTNTTNAKKEKKSAKNYNQPWGIHVSLTESRRFLLLKAVLIPMTMNIFFLGEPSSGNTDDFASEEPSENPNSRELRDAANSIWIIAICLSRDLPRLRIQSNQIV